MARNFSHMADYASWKTKTRCRSSRHGPPHLARLPKLPERDYAGFRHLCCLNAPALFRACSRFLGLLLLDHGGWAGNNRRAASRLFDLLLGANAKAVCGDGKLLRQFAVTENLENVEPLFDDAGFHQQLGTDRRPSVEELFEVSDVDFGDNLGPGVGESALGHATHQWRAAALEDRQGFPAGAGELALMSAAGRLALPAANAATLAVGLLVLMNAFVDFVEAHGRMRLRSWFLDLRS